LAKSLLDSLVHSLQELRQNFTSSIRSITVVDFYENLHTVQDLHAIHKKDLYRLGKCTEGVQTQGAQRLGQGFASLGLRAFGTKNLDHWHAESLKESRQMAYFSTIPQ